MSGRRLSALTASAVLFLLFLLQNRPAEVLRRVRVLQATASRELALRRLAGSGAAFDRAYFVFLESARRLVPAGTPGVAISVEQPTTTALYLASYVFAPVPVLLSPRRVPMGGCLIRTPISRCASPSDRASSGRWSASAHWRASRAASPR